MSLDQTLSAGLVWLQETTTAQLLCAWCSLFTSGGRPGLGGRQTMGVATLIATKLIYQQHASA